MLAIIQASISSKPASSIAEAPPSCSWARTGARGAEGGGGLEAEGHRSTAEATSTFRWKHPLQVTPRGSGYQGSKTMIVMAFGTKFLNGEVSGPSGTGSYDVCRSWLQDEAGNVAAP